MNAKLYLEFCAQDFNGSEIAQMKISFAFICCINVLNSKLTDNLENFW